MASPKALFIKDFSNAFGQDLGSISVTDGMKSGTLELPINPDPGYQNLSLIDLKAGAGPTHFFEAFEGKIILFNLETTPTLSQETIQLYTTNGTAAGTSELSINTDVNNLRSSLSGGQFAQFGDKLLIFDQSISVNGKQPTAEFFVTDGTKAGTKTFTITGDPLAPVGLEFAPGPFFSFGNQILFLATDNNGDNTLWVSNGTAAGTKPLSVTGAETGNLFGLGATDFTLFGSKVLFSGADSSHDGGLWITDGTSGGTRELTSGDVAPRDITVVGSKALFVSAPGLGGTLWVTDGTSPGTHAVAFAGNSEFLAVQELTAFGNEVLFDSTAGLFVSDGTAAGTHELKWEGFIPSGFIALGNKVLFEAEDASHKSELWVTDGTSAGTTEILIPSKNVDIFGIFGAGVSFQGAVIGDEVVFSGTNHLGVTGLWVTDGTAAGTKQIEAPISATDLTSVPLPPPPPAPSGLALLAASDSGTKGDGITNVTKPTLTGKGVAGDKVTLRAGGKTIGAATVAKGGTWSVTPASALAAGVHTLTATESGKTGTSVASAALKLTIKTSAAVPSGLGFAVGADKGAAGDVVTVTGSGEAGDRVTVFDGTNALRGATVGAGGAWTISLNPLAVGVHSLSASEVDVAGNTSARSPAQRLTIAHASPNAVTFFGSAGADHFSGGAGNDVFRFSAADLAASDIVKGGGGSDQLRLTSPGNIRATGVGGVETYVLFNGAGNVLSLFNANFIGVTGSTITVDGGNAADTLSEAGVSALDKAVLRGGAGADTLVAGRNAVLTGGVGKDVFELTVAGSPTTPDTNTITDFAHGVDKIAFSEKGFDLGSTPAAATLFAANKTGSFGSAAQRFAYDTTDGALFFDAHGSAAHSSQELIATLTHSPTLAASDISFVA